MQANQKASYNFCFCKIPNIKYMIKHVLVFYKILYLKNILKLSYYLCFRKILLELLSGFPRSTKKRNQFL